MQHKWFLKLLTALVWGLAAASAVYWGLRISQTGAAPAMTASAEPAALPTADLVALARLLGHQAAVAEQAAPTSQRWALLGVIAQGRQGVALLSVDGKPPRPYAVGSALDESLTLKAVGPRHVELAAKGAPESSAVQRLQIPAQEEQAVPAGLILGAAPKP